MDCKKIERYLEDFYKDDSGMNYSVWNYDDGCLLMAAIQLYEALGRKDYRDFVLRYLDRCVGEDGTIANYHREKFHLDNIAPGRALVFAYEQTGEERYKTACDTLMEQLHSQPRTAAGNFWHKDIYPDQVWLDGLYMAMPFYAAYDTKFGKKNHYMDILAQFTEVRKRMFDQEKKLYYHGYDAAGKIFWADPETGCSANFWLRAMGWLMMGLVDTMEEMDNRVYDIYRPLADMYQEGIRGMLSYRDSASGLFYQLVNQNELQLPENYLETSGSAMVAASIFKACRMRVLLTEKYQPAAKKMLASLVENHLIERDGKLVLTNTCHVAGLGPEEGRRDGSASYYLSEKVTENDKKGIATLAMSYGQYVKLLQKEKAIFAI